MLSALKLDLPANGRVRLLSYLSLLQKWNRTYNLTALRAPEEMLSHHLADCLAVLPALRRQVGQAGLGTPRLLDVGSGGGLPGVVLAIAEPAWQVTCVDAVAKKAAFVQQVAAELGLPNLRAQQARVEALAGHYDVIVSRAFATLPDFTRWTQHLLAPASSPQRDAGRPPVGEPTPDGPGPSSAPPAYRPGRAGVWLAMKGRHPADELAALPPEVEVFHVEPLQVPGLRAERCLIWMRRG